MKSSGLQYAPQFRIANRTGLMSEEGSDHSVFVTKTCAAVLGGLVAEPAIDVPYLGTFLLAHVVEDELGVGRFPMAQ
jgi:hypothetical protein